MQAPDAGHASSQLPPEQSVVHGDEAHVALQLPDEHEHVVPEQEALLRPAAVPGSATGGPPLGPPDVVVLLEPPHAQSVMAASIHVLKRERVIQIAFPLLVMGSSVGLGLAEVTGFFASR